MGPLFSLTQESATTIVKSAQNVGLSGFDQMIGAVGMLLVLFLVVATVCEQILELFRGFLGPVDVHFNRMTVAARATSAP